MLHVWLLRRHWLVHLAIAWGLAVTAAPNPATAAPLPPMRDGASAGNLEAVRALLEQRIARQRLSELGVSPAEAATVLERLTPEERSEFATRAHELGAGGDGLAAIGLAAIVALLVILILELMGRRVISRS